MENLDPPPCIPFQMPFASQIVKHHESIHSGKKVMKYSRVQIGIVMTFYLQAKSTG